MISLLILSGLFNHMPATPNGPLITVPPNVLQVNPKNEANHCFYDDTGAIVCEYRPPEPAPATKTLPNNIPVPKPNRRQRG